MSNRNLTSNMTQKTLLDTLNQHNQAQGLIQPHATLVIGLSGGPDSVFLLHWLATLKNSHNLTLIAAHLNHQWRPEAEQDAQLCLQMAQKQGIPLVIQTMANLGLNLKFNGSNEEMGRKARRFFLESVAQKHNATAIALAHHADDQQETFFIRMMRGASLAGLAGMKPKDGLYIRPLLQVKKTAILAYLKENDIAYALDASNESDAYLRNRIRNQVIPALQKADDRFDQTFAATHAQLQQTDEFLHTLTLQTVAQLCDANNGMHTSNFLALHPVLQKRVLIQWLIMHKVPFTPSQGLLEEIVRFLQQPGSAKHMLYGKWHIVKNDQKTNIHI
jgi:tRNA(Ile)-lysidine synthase